MDRLPACLKTALFLTPLLVAEIQARSLAGFPQGNGWQEPQEESQETPSRSGRAGRGREEPSIKPYEEVITAEAKSDDGVFTVHQVKSKYYFEIPAGELGREFVLVSRIARTVDGVGYGGQKVGTRVVKWERNGDRVLFKEVFYNVVAASDLPIRRAVEAANNDTIIQIFDLAAEGPEGAVVIEVSDLYTTDVFEMSAKRRLQARGLDRNRSFLNRISSYPENIEVEATHTYTRPEQQSGGGRTGTHPHEPLFRSRNEPRQCQCGHALQHGETARGTDDAPALR